MHTRTCINFTLPLFCIHTDTHTWRLHFKDDENLCVFNAFLYKL